MKSIVFLRKTWKKWAADHRDASDPQESASPFSTSALPKSPCSPSQSRRDRPTLRGNTLRPVPDAPCRAQGSLTASQFPIHGCDQLPEVSSQLPYSSTDATDRSHKLLTSHELSSGIGNSVPYPKSSPLAVNRPLDVFTTHCLADKYPYKSTNHTRSTDTFSTTSSDEVHYGQKMFHLVDAKPRTLCHRTRSMPYLPDEESIKARSVNSVNSSEGKFPLSLFPTPPPLAARKRIPPPLVLCNSPPATSPQSSCDSTPVATPTTPRFLSPSSPSQSSFGSCKKSHISRRVASISPPPFSPPNSPLPSPPVYYEDTNGRPLDYAGRPLRTLYSSNSLKDAQPFPAIHRLTCSEHISDQSSLPIKKSRKPRPEGMEPEHRQTSSEVRDQASLTATENNVQWGYAF